MYEAFYGLTARPFRETLDPDDWMPTPSREAVLRRLRYGLEQADGPALLFGPNGAGKSFLARVLARDLGWREAILAFPALPPLDLLAMAADELDRANGIVNADATPPGEPPHQTVRRIQRAFAAAGARGRRLLLIVDEAHLIADPDAFETLRLLLNFHSEGTPTAALLLVGGPEVWLRMPRSMSDRLAAHALAGPLSDDEASRYVEGRLRRSGADRPLFHADAVALLHQAADGLPRRLNRLADLSLLIASDQRLPRVDRDCAQEAIEESAEVGPRSRD